MVTLNMEHVLIIAIVAFVLYYFVGRCQCNGFSVGGKSTLVCVDKWGNNFEGNCNIEEATRCTDNNQCQGCRTCSNSNYCQGKSECPT